MINIKEEVEKYTWFHSIDLGDGIITNGYDTHGLLNIIKLPEDLTNKTVIDLGANEGFFSFACEKRNASRVFAVDHGYIKSSDNKECVKSKFELAHSLLKSKVEYLGADLHNISADILGKFDISLFMGILYHVDNPIQVLKITHGLTKELCILETHVDMLDVEESTTRFYPATTTGRHWWGPNLKCVEAWALAAGFRKVKFVQVWGRSEEPKHIGRAIFHLYP
jgi:tRNA (mo5U34)-methyltransferase